MAKLYANMSDLLKPASTENFKLDKFSVNADDFRAVLAGIPQGEYVRLLDTSKLNEVVMSNTPMEKRTNAEFMRKAHGDILIAGLGIGMLPISLQDRDTVRSITVIEKELEVIELITDQLSFKSKVKIIHEDIYLYRPERTFDCIYIDIWNYINSDVYKDMLFLKDGFRRYLKPKHESPERFIKCWAEAEARYGHPLV